MMPRSFFTILEKSLTTYKADLTIFMIEKSSGKIWVPREK
jgi:hypothetical protein